MSLPPTRILIARLIGLICLVTIILVSLYEKNSGNLAAAIIVSLFLTFCIVTYLGGPQHSLIYILFGFCYKPNFTITGDVSPGYEPVKNLFTQNFQQGMEDGAQICAYANGKKVIDMYGVYKKHSYFGKGKYSEIKEYNKDSLQNSFSSTKSVTAIVVAWLVEQDLLNYDEKICTYWPEFAQHGKGHITLADLMRHEAGLDETGTDQIIPDTVSRQSIKDNFIGKVYENSTPVWKSDTPRKYHAITRGWIINEIVRRVDRQKRTVGEILKQEITDPMNCDGVYIGINEDQLERSHDVKLSSCFWYCLHGCCPKFLGSKINWNCCLIGIIYAILNCTKSKWSMDGFNSKETKTGEVPSANGQCNASGFAKLAAMMAAGGVWEGKRILKKETVELALSKALVKKDAGLQKTTKFTQGGFGVFDKDQELGNKGVVQDKVSVGFVGWGGLGGSIFQWQPQENIAFSFTLNLLEMDMSNVKGGELQAEFWRCYQANKTYDGNNNDQNNSLDQQFIY